MDLTYLELLLMALVVVAAGINFYFGRNNGLRNGNAGNTSIFS